MAGKHPLVVILGPTAVGKTHLAIRMAQALDGEIIGADSRQIYRYMDIGTAKPTPAECQQAVHHLIDIVNPDENLTAAEYQDHAYSRIKDITRRGKLPLLVGGTGQYISAVIEGWSFPRVPPNETIRAELEQYALEQGNNALHARLNMVDAAAAEKIHPNNVRRVVRALEVYMETGTPISILQQKKPPPYKILVYGLTMDREALYERADKRVDDMIKQGFVAEVQQLLDMGYDRSLPSMSGLGYLEIAGHLRDDTPLEDAIERTKFSTHDFIRRQYVWFRGHVNDILWHNVVNLDIDDLIASTELWLLQGKK